MSGRWMGAIVVLVAASCAAPLPTSSPSLPPAPTPPSTCTPEANQPPVVTILDIDDNAIEGEVGVFCVAGGGSPSPAASSRPVVRLTDEEINVVVSSDEGSPFVDWLAYSTGRPGSPPGAVLLSEGSAPDGVESISFAGPRGGDWTLVVVLTFAGDAGSASYFWDVTVP